VKLERRFSLSTSLSRSEKNKNINQSDGLYVLARYYGEMCDKVRQTDNKAALAYSCSAIACQYTTKLSAHSAKGREVTWQADLTDWA